MFLPDVLSFNDYYPFGMLVPRRHSSLESYKYGFQNQEKDDELKGEGNSLNYTFRMHDPRVGRFFATDPLTARFPFYSPYQFSGNRTLDAIELEGMEDSFEIRTRRRDEAYLSKKITTDEYIEQQRAESMGGVLGASILVDIYITKGWLSRSLIGAGLLESINETERGYEAQKNGNQKEAERRFRNAGEATEIVILGLVADGIGYSIGRIASTIKLTKNLDGFKFAQTSINKAEKFSDQRAKILSAKAGTEINEVNDLVNALKSGKITPKDIPLDYVVRNGENVILNTRTSTALNRAGIPMNKWYGVNQTGKTAYKTTAGVKTFDELAEDQIAKSYKTVEVLSTKPLE